MQVVKARLGWTAFRGQTEHDVSPILQSDFLNGIGLQMPLKAWSRALVVEAEIARFRAGQLGMRA